MRLNHSKAIGISAALLFAASIWRLHLSTTVVPISPAPSASIPKPPQRLPKLYLKEPLPAEITCLAWPPAGNRIAYGDAAGNVTIFDPLTGEIHGPIQVSRDPVSSLAFTRDGSRFAAGCGHDSNWNGIGQRGNGGVWDVASGKAVVRLTGISHIVSAVAFATDGKSFATVSNESGINPPDADANFVKIWDAHTGALQSLIGESDYELDGIAFSPDGKMLAVSALEVPGTGVGVDNGHLKARIALFGANGFKTGKTLEFDNGHRLSFAWTPDSQNITIGFDSRYIEQDDFGLIQNWNIATGKLKPVCRTVMEWPSALWSWGVKELVWSPNDKALAILRRCQGTNATDAQIWDAENSVFASDLPNGLGPHVRIGSVNPLDCVAFSPDGSELATAGSASTGPWGEIHIWSWRDGGTVTGSYDQHSVLSAMAACPGDTLVTGLTGEWDIDGQWYNLEVWDLKTGQLVKQIPGAGELISFRYSKAKGVLVSEIRGDGAGKPDRWNFWKGPEFNFIGAQTAPISCSGSFSDSSNDGPRATRPGGNEEAEATQSGIWVTNRRSGAAIAQLRVPHNVTALAYSSDGTKLAVLCNDGLVRVWGATDFQPKLTLQLDQNIFGPNGQPEADWIANTPDGFYTCSPGAASRFKWYENGLPYSGPNGALDYDHPDFVARELGAPQHRPPAPTGAPLERDWSGDLPVTLATENESGSSFTFAS